MKILIVEDDPRQAEQLGVSLSGVVRYAEALEPAVLELERFGPDVVVLDAIFPLRQGRNQVASFMADRFLDAVDEIYEGRPHRRPDVVLISGEEQAARQVPVVGEWLRSGRVSDVLPKGVGWNFFRAVLSEKVERLLERRRLFTAISDAQGAFASLEAFGMVTRHPEMALVWRRLVQAAETGMHTFIYGESGVGKEPAARAIAALRNRKLYPHYCAQPPGLFASMIFGTVRGVYPDARDSPGWIEEAGSDLLYLNEFCSTPTECQAQLLQVLDSDTREYSRLGENRRRRAQCMFLFADNIDPLKATAPDSPFNKQLLPALANRAAGLLVWIPPLRDRRSDIPLLVESFLLAANKQCNKVVSFKDDVHEAFQLADWTDGNVRQLKLRVETLVAILDNGEYRLGDIGSSLSGKESTFLAQELGIDPSTWRVKPTVLMIGGDLRENLIVLRAQMFEPNSAAWRSLSGIARLSPPDEDLVFDLLCRAVRESSNPWLADLVLQLDAGAQESGSAEFSAVLILWLKNLRRKLHDRASNNPATHLHLCALLFLVLSTDHAMDRGDLQRISGRGYTQAASLEDSLVAAGAPIVRSISRL